jgi:hypothetical protein
VGAHGYWLQSSPMRTRWTGSPQVPGQQVPGSHSRIRAHRRDAHSASIRHADAILVSARSTPRQIADGWVRRDSSAETHDNDAI